MMNVNAALSDHDLGLFEPVESGYQAICRMCGKSVWVGNSRVMYSLLGERSPERPPDTDWLKPWRKWWGIKPDTMSGLQGNIVSVDALRVERPYCRQYVLKQFHG
jgi:hypothetical protein